MPVIAPNTAENSPVGKQMPPKQPSSRADLNLPPWMKELDTG